MTKNINILIVEDSKTQSERLSQILLSHGFSIKIVHNGQEALDLITTGYLPTLIISDVIMPIMNGYEFCKKLHNIPQYKNLPVILLTTLSDTQDLIAALQNNANFYITKPYEEEHLLKSVNSILHITKRRETETTTAGDQLKIYLDDKEYVIHAAKSQIADLLISTYDAMLQKNRQLYEARLELQELNNMLEQKVAERTEELRAEMEERKRYQNQLFQVQKMESIGQLTGGIAHDFNNLLMIIQGYLEMLRINLAGAEQHTQPIDQALEAVHNGADLIKQLMAFSRMQQLQPKVVNLQNAIPEIAKLFKPLVGAGIDIKLNIDENTFPVWIDQAQLENAMINLAVNARDAMNSKGTLTIELSNVSLTNEAIIGKYNIPPGEYAKLSVIDTGEGVSPEDLDKIFEPFFTTKEVGKGTGLGLSMVYGFVKQSNGHITAYSEINKGTVFNLYLPKATAEQSSNVEMTREPKPKLVTQVHGNETILFVEDENNLRRLTANYLESLGYRVIQAESGDEALNFFQNEKNIHLILTDVVMPGSLTGPELVSEILTLSPKTKVIFISGYPKSSFVDTHIVKDFPMLTKPFSRLDLATLLRNVLEPATSH